MKTIVITLFMLMSATIMLAQNQVLSPEAEKLFKKATIMLAEGVSTIKEYQFVASEFEQVLNTNPNHANTLYNLALVYSTISSFEGNYPAFYQSERYYKRYLATNPDDKDVVEMELLNLLTKREKNETAGKVTDSEYYIVYKNIGDIFFMLYDKFSHKYNFQFWNNANKVVDRFLQYRSLKEMGGWLYTRYYPYKKIPKRKQKQIVQNIQKENLDSIYFESVYNVALLLEKRIKYLDESDINYNKNSWLGVSDYDAAYNCKTYKDAVLQIKIQMYDDCITLFNLYLESNPDNKSEIEDKILKLEVARDRLKLEE
ncbi:MAG: hypothetical protein LBR17_07005 [Bacteroidales bacterium]|jgi:tetratricopeptide (TPR) repeat protein|nr:hypothetical protein [Bacteroidales bacterium]